MPTGYTSAVQSGEVTEFSEFAMRCARAMGALIMMRDEPWDAPIPERFEPSTYHVEALAKAEARLMGLRSMTPEQIRAAWQEAQRAEEARNAEYRDRKVVEESRYRAMIAEVEAWTPPTDEHVGLKEFMLQQLHESVRFDCGDWMPERTVRGMQEWWQAEVTKAERDISYHTEHDRQERERTEARNRWIAALRASLPTETANV